MTSLFAGRIRASSLTIFALRPVIRTISVTTCLAALLAAQALIPAAAYGQAKPTRDEKVRRPRVRRHEDPERAGLLYAGSSTIPGIGLPMCLISAELVLKRLRGDTSSGPSPEPAADGHDAGAGVAVGLR